MLMYSGCSSWPVAWVVRDADRLLDFASEFLLLSLLGLRERPLADLVLFLEALGSVGRSSSSLEYIWLLFAAMRGELRLLEDLDPELPFLESRLSLATVGVDGCCSSSSTFFLISSLFSDGTGLSELVGVWVRDAFLDDFLVSGD